MLLYSTVSNPQDCSTRVTLARRLFATIIRSCPPLSVARYSFLQLSKLKQRGHNEIAQTSKRHQVVSACVPLDGDVLSNGLLRLSIASLLYLSGRQL